MRGLHDLGILGFIGNIQRQIVLLDRDKLLASISESKKP